MLGAATIEEIKQRQRRVFLLGFSAAGVPIFCQLPVAVAVASRKQDFPEAEHDMLGVRFWCVQMMLLCVAVSGKPIIDFGKHIVNHSANNLGFVSQFLALAFFFLANSILFSFTLLDSKLSLPIILPMIIFPSVDLYLAYRVDMEIALAEPESP